MSHRKKQQPAGRVAANQDAGNGAKSIDSSNEFNPVGRAWARIVRTRSGRIFAMCFAVVVVVAAFGEGLEKIKELYNGTMKFFDSTQWPLEPSVLYIYANGDFGVLRKIGFERGSDAFERKQIYHVQYLPASFERLKQGDIDEIKAELSSRLKANTIAAVVAPSLTEATRPVIQFVRELNRTVPIILESSIDPADLNWEEDGHLFRLSSGVDTRGLEIGHVILSLAKSGRPVAILAEDGPETYGGKMLHYASSVSPAIDAVPTFRFAAGKLDQLIASKTANFESDPALRRMKDPAAVVFFLGLGRDLEAILNSAYRDTSPMRGEAKIVGVMNAYKLASLFESQPNPVRSHLIYEITDFDFIFPFNPPEAAVAFGRMLAGSKPLTPVLRDQAYSYDEAVLLGQAISSAAGSRSYHEGLDKLNSYLKGYSGRGVTGNIVLTGRAHDSSGAPRIPIGQNVGSTILRLSAYEPDSHAWVITDAAAL